MIPEKFLNHPALSNISKEKLDFLLRFGDSLTGNLSANELAKIMSNAANTAKQNGYTFSSDETDLIIQLLKEHMTKEEREKTDKIIKLLQIYRPT